MDNPGTKASWTDGVKCPKCGLTSNATDEKCRVCATPLAQPRSGSVSPETSPTLDIGTQQAPTGATKVDELLLRTDECKICKRTFRKNDMFRSGLSRYCFPCIEKAFKGGARVGNGYVPWLPLLLVGIFVVGGGLSTALGVSMQYRTMLAIAVGLAVATLGSSIPVGKVLDLASGKHSKLNLERLFQLVRKQASCEASEAEQDELWTACSCPTEVHMLRDLALPEYRGRAFTWARPQRVAGGVYQDPPRDPESEPWGHPVERASAAPASLAPPKMMPDGTACRHEGETANYCTRCWTYLKSCDR